MVHGNSHQNKKPHHLYEIFDEQEEETYKFGISADEIDADDSSDRLRNQLKLFNLIANAIHFVGRILVRNIPGRESAERLEDDYIEDHVKKYGKRPRGNPPRK
jgi:hypothetical protein